MDSIECEAKEGNWRPWLFTSLAGIVATLGLIAVAAAEHAGTNVVKSPAAGLVNYTPNPHLEGRLAIAGSDTMRPLLTRLVGNFTLQHRKVKIAVESFGSAQGIREFIIGISAQRRGDKLRGTGHDGASQVTVLASSREMTAEERNKFSSRFGYEPLAIPIALDAVAIYAHKSNPIRSLTLDQVDGIFSSTRKRGGPDIMTWGQLGLETLGTQPIHLYSRDKRSGTRDFFDAVALQGGDLKPSATEEPGSASEVLAIAGDALGIGYAGVGFEISDVRVVPLAKESGAAAIAPTTETVANGSYPLSRPLYLYVNQGPNAKFDPVLLEFLRYVNSPQGQSVVVSAKAYPLPQVLLAKNLDLLNTASPTSQVTTAASVGTSQQAGTPDY